MLEVISFSSNLSKYIRDDNKQLITSTLSEICFSLGLCGEHEGFKRVGNT